ncbi:ATP-binding cassette domain-containing protein [Apibacter sp. ESL0432]|uniref:ATP-binding cassette domain-containing protein n=1 Tax=Apibacter sp. ESL0432 TaxID=2704652 RepID=UPI001C69EF24|nr:ATP-binding cassette domain-containing protein [Apibacter sp. ESL0432]
MNTMVELDNIIPKKEFAKFSTPINWKIAPTQHWAVIGPNGAGKSLLIDILLGKYALQEGKINYTKKFNHLSDFIKIVAFKNIHALSKTQNSYYQQRWNKGLEDETPQVKDLLFKNTDLQWMEYLISLVGIEDLMEKNIDLLSSGELRKFLIIQSLSTKPEILILDNPYIGLDTKARQVLDQILLNLKNLQNLQVIVLISNIADISPIITHVLPINNKTLFPSKTSQEFFEDKKLQNELFPHFNYELKKLPYPSNQPKEISYNYALQLNNLNIRYGNRTILKNISWKVKKGEKWALSGPNGSGKSTLLSVIAADNPQAYANDILLFDKKRGTGESIWDIKKHMGYISPEMHLYYQKNVTCLEVVGSGFFDTIGLYRKCDQEQIKVSLQWMEILGIEKLKNSSFLSISTGEQRLVLLARVFVKNPSLVILDEPLHGLDMNNKFRVLQIIEKFCDPSKALIYVTHYKEELPSLINHELSLTKIQ